MADTRPVMKIFFGPPGTGKTWRAKREAVRIIEPTIAEKDITAKHDELVRAGRIIWVTFHPNYSYEDFVEGFRPISRDGDVVYEVREGPFKRACATASGNTRSFLRGDQVGDYTVVDADEGGVVLERHFERSDQVNDEASRAYVDYWTIEHVRSKGLKPADLSVSGKDNNKKQALAKKTGLPTTFFANSSRHRAVYEAMTAKAATGQPVVVVIDEINRADLSRVFGELLTLVEVDKRLGATEERRIFLPYSQQLFGVPQGVSLVGTMNTADKSLSVIDLALRRRFDFHYIGPDLSLCPDKYAEIDVRAFLKALNDRISVVHSRDAVIGHSELMESNLETTRAANGGKADDDGRRRALACVVRRKLVPLVLEYFHDDWRRAGLVLGCRREKDDLIERTQVKLPDDDFADLDETQTFDLPGWWDPDGSAWDGNRFAAAIALATKA